MKEILPAISFILVLFAQPSGGRAQSPPPTHRPPIAIERAIEIAKEYTDSRRIDTSEHYIDSAKLVPAGTDTQEKYWEVRWERSEIRCKGCYFIIRVQMDGRAGMIYGK